MRPRVGHMHGHWYGFHTCRRRHKLPNLHRDLPNVVLELDWHSRVRDSRRMGGQYISIILRTLLSQHVMMMMMQCMLLKTRALYKVWMAYCHLMSSIDARS